jgi:NADPH:quinone reductase
VGIDVHAAGVGFDDALVTRGQVSGATGSAVCPGMEVAGVVADAPDGSGLRIGQRVIGSVPVGGCAETVWAPGHHVAPLGEALTFAEGAAMVVNYHTALLGLTRRAGLRFGQQVLVHGAGGGQGSAFRRSPLPWALRSSRRRIAEASPSCPDGGGPGGP